MRTFRGLFVWAAIVIGVVVGSSDDGPGDPVFSPNDGELENAVNPLNTPEGNFVIEEEKGVSVLKRDTFAFYVKPKKLVMVEFYAPECVHCKRLEPDFAKAAVELKEYGVHLAKVDVTKEAELAKVYFVQAYPTLIIFKNGEKFQDYTGDRSGEAIINHMMALNDPNWVPPPSPIITLTTDNFTKFVNDKKLSLVMFYAPWCKHCKQVLPELEGAAAELKGWGIPLIKVDGTKEKELADQYSIGAWPTFKMFRQGRMYDYNGPREREKIITFMKAQAKPPSEEKNHSLGITNNFDRTEITVVGFFLSKSDLYDEYLVAANEMRGTFKFFHSFSQETADSFKVPLESVTVFMPDIFLSPYENKTHTLSKKSATNKDIISFIKKYSVPLVGQRTKKNDFKYTGRPLIVIYYDVNYEHQNFVADTQYIRGKVLEVAKNFIGSSLKFAISNEDEFADEIKNLGSEDSSVDVSVGCFTEKQKFRMKPTEEFETEDLANFVDDLKNGKITPYMKSQPVPENQQGPVKLIVANNYDGEIHKVKKDAVLFIHAPWCSHCKDFDPVYKKIAKKMLKTNENIIFGKMDGTTNDIPYMYPPVNGYPAIFFLSANEKYDPIQFKGDRTFKSVKDWINRHSSVFLTEEERTGQAAEEIESFTSENFEDDINKAKEENPFEYLANGEKKKDEL